MGLLRTSVLFAALLVIICLLAYSAHRQAPARPTFAPLKRDLLELRHTAADAHAYGNFVMPGPFTEALNQLQIDYRLYPKPSARTCTMVDAVMAHATILRRMPGSSPQSLLTNTRINLLHSAEDAVAAIEQEETPAQ